MKKVHKDVCSCTSCSKRKSLSRRSLIADGSKIDQLYLGKYIPLREQTLLGKLVKTRAEYDEVRQELLSASDISVHEKADLRPRKHVSKKHDKNKRKIEELVEMVDKGAALGKEDVSECCSCCSCDSISDHTRHKHKEQRHKTLHSRRGSKSTLSYLDVGRSNKQRDRRLKKAAHSRAKKINSAPCLCTFDLLDLNSSLKEKSNQIIKRMRGNQEQEEVDPGYAVAEEYKRRSKELALKARNQLKRSLEDGKHKTRESIKKVKTKMKEKVAEVNDSGSRLQQNFKQAVEKSKEKQHDKINKTKQKIKKKVKDEIKKSLMKMDQFLEEGVCEHECYPEECDPQECLQILLRNRAQREKQKRGQIKSDKVIRRDKGTGETKSGSSVSIQSQHPGSAVKVGTKKQASRRKPLSRVVKPKISITIGTNNKKGTSNKSGISDIFGNKDMQVMRRKKSKHESKSQREVVKEGKEKRRSPTESVSKSQSQVKGNLKASRIVKSQTKIKIYKDVTCLCEKKSRKMTKKTSSRHTASSNPVSTSSGSSVSQPFHKPKHQKSGMSEKSHKNKRFETREIRQHKNKPPIDSSSDHRQAVRIGSTFSFSVEFFKDSYDAEHTRYVKGHDVKKHLSKETLTHTRHKGHQAIKTTKLNKKSEIRLKQKQAGGHALKRCFCTLKLKAKMNKMQDSKGTRAPKHLKELNSHTTTSIQTRPKSLLPYECEPFLCIPDECDPYECEKLIKKRLAKHHSTPSNTVSSTRSISSVTKSATSKLTHASPQLKTKRNQRKSQVSSVKHMIYKKPQRRAVRIGSTFSFKVEFFKDNLDGQRTISSTNITNEDKNKLKEIMWSKSKNENKRRSKHKSSGKIKRKVSQSNTSPARSNTSTTRKSLKRCFCTLKLKPGKTKTVRSKLKTSSKGSLKTHRNAPKQKDTTSKAIASKFTNTVLKRCFCTLKLQKINNKDNKKIKDVSYTGTGTSKVDVHANLATKSTETTKKRLNLLPYECEPGICIPGDCNPTQCIEMIKKKSFKHRTKYFNTGVKRFKYRSTSVGSHAPVKKVHSSVITQKVPSQTYKGNRNVANESKITRGVLSPSRQAVRIGSTFSFNIEFSKDTQSVVSNSQGDFKSTTRKIPFEYKRKQVSRIAKKKERGSQNDFKPKQKSVPLQVDENRFNKLTDTALNRCLCTLNLKKDKKLEQEISKTKNMTSTRTETPTQKVQASLVTKGTEIIKKRSKLLPYQCEPGICISGKCDPYACLKLISKREGTSTKRYAKYSSTDTNRSTFSSNLNRRHHKAKAVQSSAYKAKVPTRQHREITVIKEPKQYNNSPKGLNHQAIRIGSTLSFKVEFFKDTPSGLINVPRTLEKVPADQKKETRNIHRSQGIYSKPQQNSVPVQVKKKKLNKQIGTVVKRCFCTLKLVKNKYTKDTGHQQLKEISSTGTVTSKWKIRPNYVTKGTKTLKKFECEPYICAPEECDPHECLERIKRLNTQDFGTSTKRTELVSASSYIPTSVITSGTETYRPKTKYQNTSKKTKMRYQYTKTKPKPENIHPPKILVDSSSRQSVTIGSSFRFSVELFKDKPTTSLAERKHLVHNPPNEKPISTIRKYFKNNNVLQGRTIDVSKSDHNSQSKVAKKTNKGTKIKPKLKRCFCTFQLMKQINQQQKKQRMSEQNHQVYNVSRATVENTKTPFLNSLFSKEFPLGHSFFSIPYRSATIISSEKIHDVMMCYSTTDYSFNRSLPISKSNSAVYYSTNNCYDVLLDQTKNLYNQKLIKQYKKILYTNKMERETKSKSISQVTLFNQYSRRCYCIMNMRVANSLRKIKQHRLQSYECEPEVCVPYKCDPYECQKRIIKRSRKSSKIHDAHPKRKSSSIYTDRRYNEKNIQINANQRYPKHIKTGGINYKLSPSYTSLSGSGKHTCRVGSTFSFDIEFSKYLKPTEKLSPDKYFSEARIKTVKKGAEKQNFQRTGESQSGSLMKDITSNITPKLKRCYCTLQLQNKILQKDKWHNKGKLEKKQVHSIIQPRLIFPKKNKEVAKAEKVHVGQNTKKQKLYQSIALHPYECEPNICIPEQCNPNVCLEMIRMKKYTNKGLGTESIQSRSIATHSKNQRKRKQVQTVQKQDKIRGDSTRCKDIPSRKQILHTFGVPSHSHGFRIGSNFSFDIEFYKDRGRLPVSNKTAPLVMKVKPPELKKNKIHARDTQAIVYQKDRSSVIVPIMKRCLCTMHLKNKKVFDRNNVKLIKKNHKYVNQKVVTKKDRASGIGLIFKRCFCTLQLQKQRIHEKNQQNSVNRGTKTRPIKDTPTWQIRSISTSRKNNQKVLKPYECEPYVCVPGECDPYECDKFTKKRLHKEFGTITTKHGTKSEASMTSTKSRSVRGQFNGRRQNTRRKSIQPKDLNHHKIYTASENARERCLRISSSFNFDLKFGKNCSGGDPVSVLIPLKTQEYSEERQLYTRPKVKTKSRSTKTHDERYIMKEAPTISSPFLKRCFCTLSLRNKPNPAMIPIPKAKSDATTKTKIYKPENLVYLKNKATSPNKNQFRKLKPYECEPGVCVPGHCDPYECVKRIKMLKMPSKMTNTGRPKERTIHSHTRQARVKNTPCQFKQKYKNRRTDGSKWVVEEPRFKGLNPFGNALHISSSLTFHMEFGKDTCTNNIYESQPKKYYKTNTTLPKIHKNNMFYRDNISHRTLKIQANDKVKTETKGTGGVPLLERCLCTLKLQKIGKQAGLRGGKGQGTANISVVTKNSFHDLEPYECETGFCIPGQCDSYECEKRIKRRFMKDSGTATTQCTNKCVSTFTSPDAKCKAVCAATKVKCTGICATKHHKTRLTGRNKNRSSQPHLAPWVYKAPETKALSIASKFSFDVKIFKDRPHDSVCKTRVMRPRDHYTKGYNGDIHRRHNKSQIANVEHETKRSGADKLRRCFCTLQFQKSLHNRRDIKTVNYVSVVNRLRENANNNRMPISPKPIPTKKTFSPYERKITEQSNDINEVQKTEVQKKGTTVQCVKNQIPPLDLVELKSVKHKIRQSDNLKTPDKHVKVENKFTSARYFFKKCFSNSNKAVAASSAVKKSQYKVAEGSKSITLLGLEDFNLEHSKLNMRDYLTMKAREIVMPSETHKSKSISNALLYAKCHEMETLFPYKPNKFNKMVSKTIITKTRKENLFVSKKLNSTKFFDICRKNIKLIMNKSNKSRNQSSYKQKCVKSNFNKVNLFKIMHQCTKYFGKPRRDIIILSMDHKESISKLNHNNCQNKNYKQKKTLHTDTLKISKSDRRPMDSNIETILKKTKSLKVTQVSEKNQRRTKKRMNDIVPEKKKYSHYQSGDTIKYERQSTLNIMSTGKKKSDCINVRNEKKLNLINEMYPLINNNIVNFALISQKYPHLIQDNTNHKKYSTKVGKCKVIKTICSCSKNTWKSPVKADDNSNVENTNFKLRKAFDDEEFTMKNVKEHNNRRKIWEFKKTINDNQESNTVRHNEKCNIEPLFEIKLNSNDMNIVNRQEIMQEIAKLKIQLEKEKTAVIRPQHGKSCQCCICKSRSKIRKTKTERISNEIEAQTHTKASPIKYNRPNFPKLNLPSLRLPSSAKAKEHTISERRICICGSKPCEEALLKSEAAKKLEKQRKKPRKTCECGSKICRDESLKQDLKNKIITKKGLTKKKREEKAETNRVANEKMTKLKEKDLRRREIEYKKADAIRKKQQLRKEKHWNKQVDKYKNSSDKMLFAESIVDVVKFGVQTITGILRCACRAVWDPKHVINKVKVASQDPRRILATAQSAFSEGSAGATAQRVAKRIGSMAVVNDVKEKIESNQYANYMYHSFDNDPKARLKVKPRRRRRREPVDFECSLFMSSLRKRPWLWVYYKCPWFYPHCISIVNIWHQVTDVLLFILAVFVWSPCILSMELCRACMCCTLCTA